MSYTRFYSEHRVVLSVVSRPQTLVSRDRRVQRRAGRSYRIEASARREDRALACGHYGGAGRPAVVGLDVECGERVAMLTERHRPAGRVKRGNLCRWRVAARAEAHSRINHDSALLRLGLTDNPHRIYMICLDK